MYLKHVITAGILSAALAIGPGAAYAQSTGSASGTSGGSQGATSRTTSSQGTTAGSSSSQESASQPSSPSSTSSSPSSTQSASSQSGSGGADQEAVRQHLTGAREALAELTKLPAAAQLQGDQRQKVAQFISDFNAFATATTDWRPKYDTVDRSLDQLLGLDASASASGSTSGSAAGASGSASASTAGSTGSSTAGAGASGSGAVGTSGDAGTGGLDPTIEAKLREVRTHLDAFEEASGDPSFVVEKIEKILDQASSGTGSGGAVGTTGTTGSSASDGAVTLTASQVQEIRRQLDSIKAAAKR